MLSLLKKRGTLEKRLAQPGVAIKWIEFSVGPVQLEALNVGSINLLSDVFSEFAVWRQ